MFSWRLDNIALSFRRFLHWDSLLRWTHEKGEEVRHGSDKNCVLSQICQTSARESSCRRLNAGCLARAVRDRAILDRLILE